MTSTPPRDEHSARLRWPWMLLALVLLWTAAVRVPLILNAETHLDSDLAVDGLTLLEFLTGGRVRGIPLPIFPDRFPEWSRALPVGPSPVVIARPTPEGRLFADRAFRSGGRIPYRARGLTIVSWP